MTSADLNPELRKLIDGRLEAIDRVLTASAVSWSERRSILAEVETQIFELLARRSTTPTQEDVLLVLESLDSPDAYAGEAARAHVADVPLGEIPRAPDWRHLPSHAARRVLGLVPSIAAVVSLIIANGFVIAIIASTNGVIPWIATLTGIVWLNYHCVRWLKNWSAQQRHGSLVDDLRYSLGSWLMPKQAPQAS
jgi:hypothetical protein